MKKKSLIGLIVGILIIVVIVLVVLMSNKQTSSNNDNNQTTTSQKNTSERYSIRSFSTSQRVSFDGPKGYTYQEESDNKEAEFEKNINDDKITLSYKASTINENDFKSFKNVYYTKKVESNYYKDVKYQENKEIKINDFEVEYVVASYTSASDDLTTVKVLAQADKESIYPLKIEFNITTKDTKKATDYYSSVEKLLEDALDINAENE